MRCDIYSNRNSLAILKGFLMTDKTQSQATNQNYHFFAILARMRYIERWALMRNSRTETLSEHSLEVAMIAHVLCIIGNVRYGKNLNAERAALLGIYHDAPEIITGDLPTPVKYFNEQITDAYHEVEGAAAKSLIESLPEDLQASYKDILTPSPQTEEDAYLMRLLKAADKISALIKCIDESGAGNTEFKSAEASTRKIIDELAQDLPEVSDFCREFLPSFGSTLDELL